MFNLPLQFQQSPKPTPLINHRQLPDQEVEHLIYQRVVAGIVEPYEHRKRIYFQENWLVKVLAAAKVQCAVHHLERYRVVDLDCQLHYYLLQIQRRWSPGSNSIGRKFPWQLCSTPFN